MIRRKPLRAQPEAALYIDRLDPCRCSPSGLPPVTHPQTFHRFLLSKMAFLNPPYASLNLNFKVFCSHSDRFILCLPATK